MQPARCRTALTFHLDPHACDRSACIFASKCQAIWESNFHKSQNFRIPKFQNSKCLGSKISKVPKFDLVFKFLDLGTKASEFPKLIWEPKFHMSQILSDLGTKLIGDLGTKISEFPKFQNSKILGTVPRIPDAQSN